LQKEGKFMPHASVRPDVAAVPGDAGPGSAPHSAARYGLSPREREILALFVQRWTDKEIADALFVSARTVMTHATNIFTKLGVANRREAAALAARFRLV
jgi:DNA-binding NarL/FixJ family response regulator